MKALCAVQRRTMEQNLVCEAYSSERQALAVTKGRETGGKREISDMCGVLRSLYLSGLGAPVGQGLGDGTRPWPGVPLGQPGQARELGSAGLGRTGLWEPWMKLEWCPGPQSVSQSGNTLGTA